MRLHIAVDQACVVGVLQSERRLATERGCLRRCELPPPCEQSFERLAGDVLHHDERPVFVFARVVHNDDVRM